MWGKKINILFTFRLKNSKWVMLEINIEPLQTRKICLKQSVTSTSVQHELRETRFTLITEPKATEDMWENSFEDTENSKRTAISALREGRTPLRPYRAPSARGLHKAELRVQTSGGAGTGGWYLRRATKHHVMLQVFPLAFLKVISSTY